MNVAKRRAIFERLRAANPHPKTELDYTTPFELLVAVVLSAQSTDRGVNKATAQLFPVANTPQAIARLGVGGLIPYIKSTGFFNMKAKNVVALSEAIVREHAGAVPRSREALEKLPGVGRKTANVVLNVAFGEPTIAVDTHVFRVANRTGLAPGKDPEEVEAKLEAVVPDDFRLHAHHWLILHGRYTCVAKVPKCPACVINDLCEFPHKTRLVDPAQVDRVVVKKATAAVKKTPAGAKRTPTNMKKAPAGAKKAPAIGKKPPATQKTTARSPRRTRP